MCLGLLLPTVDELVVQLGILDSELSLITQPFETEENKETEKEEKKEVEMEDFYFYKANDELQSLYAANWLVEGCSFPSWVTEIPSPPPEA